MKALDGKKSATVTASHMARWCLHGLFSSGRSVDLFGFGGVGGCERLAGWEGLS